jgi:hypothetical protein
MKGGVRVNNCVPANEGREHDEGNREPANNFAIYINNKKWKVLPGLGYYADDYREQAQYRKLKDWCQKKTQTTGKKWEVAITGEPATEGVAEAGPFSYGAKKPRRGSVADLAAEKRKKQEKDNPPIEPKDQMVGVAKVTKGVAEGSEQISSMIQQYEDMVELVYDLPPGRKKNITINKRDALEAQIEAMPGGKEALRNWAKSYNDAMDEGVAEGSGYSTDPEQAKWYHEGRNAMKFGTNGDTMQEIAKKHGCPPEWLDAFRAGYKDQFDWNKKTVTEENKGLYYNVNKRKKAGISRPANHPKAPTAQAWKDAAKTAKK